MNSMTSEVIEGHIIFFCQKIHFFFKTFFDQNLIKAFKNAIIKIQLIHEIKYAI